MIKKIKLSIFLNLTKAISKYGVTETHTGSLFQFHQGVFGYELELCHEQHHKPIWVSLQSKVKDQVVLLSGSCSVSLNVLLKLANQEFGFLVPPYRVALRKMFTCIRTPMARVLSLRRTVYQAPRFIFSRVHGKQSAPRTQNYCSA